VSKTPGLTHHSTISFEAIAWNTRCGGAAISTLARISFGQVGDSARGTRARIGHLPQARFNRLRLACQNIR
jgi:hypothetical protein